MPTEGGNEFVRKYSPWLWVPTAFFAEGGPFAILSTVTVILFKTLGMNNEQMAFWTSLLMLPWAIKPLWAPVLDLFGSKRLWMIVCQLAMAALFLFAAGLMLKNSLSLFLVGVFLLLAILSATHDIAVDGFYLIALDEHAQAFFAGIRGTFYRIATVVMQGGLVILAGAIEMRSGSIRAGWAGALAVAALALALIGFWHLAVVPRAAGDLPGVGGRNGFCEFFNGFLSFFRKRGVIRLLLFLLFFRIAESQLGRIAAAFMKDPRSEGGLGLSLGEFGQLYGTWGVIALLTGGVVGGVIVSRRGFGSTVWPLVCALNLPDLVYVYLAHALPESRWIIGGCIVVEQFGYGLGYTAFMLITLAAAEDSGRFKTSHYAIMTGLAILGLSLAGMISGRIQMFLGYVDFFWYVILCTIPSFLVTIPVVRDVPRDFGLRRGEAA